MGGIILDTVVAVALVVSFWLKEDHIVLSEWVEVVVVLGLLIADIVLRIKNKKLKSGDKTPKRKPATRRHTSESGQNGGKDKCSKADQSIERMLDELRATRNEASTPNNDDLFYPDNRDEPEGTDFFGGIALGIVIVLIVAFSGICDSWSETATKILSVVIVVASAVGVRCYSNISAKKVITERKAAKAKIASDPKFLAVANEVAQMLFDKSLTDYYYNALSSCMYSNDGCYIQCKKGSIYFGIITYEFNGDPHVKEQYMHSVHCSLTKEENHAFSLMLANVLKEKHGLNVHYGSDEVIIISM